jgi:glutaminase
VGFCLQLSDVFKFHNFDNLTTSHECNRGRTYSGGETNEAGQCNKIDPRVKLKEAGADNLTHLIYAAAENRVIDVRRMIARGVNLSAHDYDGRTALHLAASEGHFDVAVVLISYGVELNLKDRFGNTPTDDAKRRGHQRIVELLEAAARPREVFGRERSADMIDTASNLSSVIHRSSPQTLIMSLSSDGTPSCTKAALAMSMYENGLLHSKRMDANFGRVHKVLSGLPKVIDETLLTEIIAKESTIADALRGELAIPGWATFKEDLGAIFNECTACEDGKVAAYIPQLAKVDSKYWAVAACSVSGQTCSFGDDSIPFCVQSCVKPLNYCLAIEAHGEQKVHQHVGREPSGQNFNEIALQHGTNLPHNPMINAGAIMTCSLLNHEDEQSERFDHVMATWQALSGGHRPGFQNSTFLSEADSADRNQCLAFLMKEKGVFPDNIQSGEDLKKTLEFYFQTCSIEVDCRAMSLVAGTLAAGGVCPVTGERVFAADTVKDCLSLMFSCGMYDYSGEFAFTCGFPSKSGVAGALLIVIPNLLGICTWSPRLDKVGNSARGVLFCKKFSERFVVHSFDAAANSLSSKLDLRINRGSDIEHDLAALAFAAGHGDLRTICELHVRGVRLDGSDYDGRTAMHVAAAEGKTKVVKWLLKNGANPNPKDRWGGTPLNDAQKYNHNKCSSVLIKHGAMKTSDRMLRKNSSLANRRCGF